jgi:release factor glutamine methyltransferase
MVTSLKQAVASAASQIGTDTARLDSQLILGHILDKPRTWLIAHDDEPISAEHETEFSRLVAERVSGKPLAYILGRQEFWSMQFEVTPDVLIPRPETELLVETVLARRHETSICIADLGTGTGAIAIALALEHPADTVIAIDRSAEALQVARRNRDRLGAPNVQLVQGSWMRCLRPSSFDIIVYNPPYIASLDQHLPDLKFEPISALVAGDDGLDDIREIIASARGCLKPGGLLALEHGYDQQPEILDLLAQAGFRNIRGEQDLANQPRITTAESL